MRRRDFNYGLIGVGGALLAGTGCSPTSTGDKGSSFPQISEKEMLREVQTAPSYPKPAGFRTGFDGVNMHQVMQVTRRPAVRVKLEMAGKPQAAQLSDGTIVVAGFIEPPVHKESRCTLQYSRDNGRTFEEPIVLELPGRTEGFRALKNDTLILGHSGGISRSADGGKTWTTFQFPSNIVPGDGSLKLGECHGPIELPDGTLMIGIARTVGKYNWECYVIRSTDDGRTWGDPTRVPTATDADEISYACLHSGRILAIARTSAAYARREGLSHLIPGSIGAPEASEAGDFQLMFYSDDKGRTWSRPQPTGLGVLQAAGAYPLPLPDGRVLLLHGHRIFPYGTQVVASRNGGMTWDIDHPIILSWHSWSGYCGHPRSVLLHDGTILTGYYTHRIDVDPSYVGEGGPGDGPPDPARNAPSPNHNRQDTGELVRWRVPDDWPPVA